MKISVDDLSTAVWIYDFDHFKIHSANTAALKLWESPSVDELTSRNFEPETSSAVREVLHSYQKRLARGESISTLWRIHPKGISKDVFGVFSPCFIDDQRLAMLVEAAPVEVLKQHTQIGSGISLSTYTLTGEFVSGNPPFLDAIGTSPGHLSDLIADNDSKARLFSAISGNGKFEDDVLLRTNDGLCWFHSLVEIVDSKRGQPLILLQLYNIHERKIKEISLAEEACKDPLTGLLSRRGLVRQFASQQFLPEELVLFYIDLDGFKLINDTYGHAIGDQLLQAVAKRLTESDLACGVACRIGGDEFIWAGFAKDLSLPVENLGKMLVATLSDHYFSEDGTPLSVSASVGIAHCPDHGNSIDQLIINADTAMYHAKKSGRRRFVRYRQGMEAALKRRSQLAQHLHKALERKEFSLLYQPIIDIRTNTILSFEALLRWDCVALEQVITDEAICTAEVINTAEEMGLIGELEDWVIQQALYDLPALRKASDSNAFVSVNISGQHLNEESFPGKLLYRIRKHGLAPEDLCVELTESSLLDHLDKPHSSVQKLAELGFPISIDDFGTGFSSLAYLHSIPAVFVKIDQSFVSRLQPNETTVSCIHQLIEGLGMLTVAEGVETKSQSKALLGLGVYLQQGRWLARPAGAENAKCWYEPVK